MNAQQKQAKYDELQKEYMAALYASPRDEQKCLEVAQQLLELARGTRLEQRQQQVVERHLRKIQN